MSQTRRLAAILAADVAGYSRLIGADEDETRPKRDDRPTWHLIETRYWSDKSTSLILGLNMITVGAFKAKTHLSSLLDRVAEGEEVVITKHGKPVARLVGAAQFDRERVNEAFEKLKLLRKQTTLGGLPWEMLRDEGRR